MTLGVTLTVLFLTLTGASEIVCMSKINENPIDFIVREPATVQNLTYGCPSQATIEILDSNKRVTVCTYQNKVRIDLRQFLNGKPTQIGLFLTPHELRQLDAMMAHLWLNVHKQNARIIV
jgi:hypothetical protein